MISVWRDVHVFLNRLFCMAVLLCMFFSLVNNVMGDFIEKNVRQSIEVFYISFENNCYIRIRYFYID